MKRTVVLVAVLNLSYFGIEFITARRIGSVSLLADSIDFLEDASVNLLIVAGLGMTLVWRARVGMVLAGILLIPAGVTLWTAWEKLRDPVAPDPLQLSLVGLGALVVNLTCALLLVRFRAKQGSLAQAAFLSARNDAIANIAIVLAEPLEILDGTPGSLIELIAPVHQRVYRMGLEHLGVVVGEEVDAFSREHRAALTGQQFQSADNEPYYVLFEDFTHVKFYRRSLYDACVLQGATFDGFVHVDNWVPQQLVHRDRPGSAAAVTEAIPPPYQGRSTPGGTRTHDLLIRRSPT